MNELIKTTLSYIAVASCFPLSVYSSYTRMPEELFSDIHGYILFFSIWGLVGFVGVATGYLIYKYGGTK